MLKIVLLLLLILEVGTMIVKYLAMNLALVGVV
jgi:hypothetical protein